MTLISLHHAYIRHSSILDHARGQRDGKAFLKECSPIHLSAKTWSLIHSPSRLGMATGRVWDGPLLPHFRPGYIFFFPSPSQTRGGASWCAPCPFTKELIIAFPSQMCFRELCFYRTWVSEISINVIRVIINTFNQAFVVQQNCKLHIQEQNAQIYK